MANKQVVGKDGQTYSVSPDGHYKNTQTGAYFHGNPTQSPNGKQGAAKQPTDNQVLGDVRGQSQNTSNVYNQLLNGAYAGLSNPNAPASQYQTAIYNQLTQGFGDQQKQEDAQSMQTLANRGIPIGSEAYNNERNRFDLNWRQKYGQAQNQAVTENINATNQGLNTLGGFNQNIFNTLTGKQIGAANNQTQLGVANINAGSALGVAGINADTASKQLQFQQNQNNQSGGAFNGVPPQ